MEQDIRSLTGSEWSLMECLWEDSPRSSMQVVSDLKRRVGWSKSTTLTMLRRMASKGLLKSTSEGGTRLYSPNLKREEATAKETKEFLDKVYQGSVSLMMSSMAENRELTQEEIDELYEILRKAEEGQK
ncbi:BlaI/MecI/CopY family transcriptional regulator [Papillibacter cinnamivorans]|uniref:Predicted transcriptional regulator n=1 Tax=Papillibacter cinnamivorans DSM 12816 TaxID=1122930 RepID=A0A1W1YP71_9FIRM|nr:BlaI/MecI/CopY family transcriptional regulator [Papillibacter cinnamivorans]SMC37538.1 Predicted transcriptional regulator [Papillibacter cinnamivorans DSM 12816]